jgi:hypothetical protein
MSADAPVIEAVVEDVVPDAPAPPETPLAVPVPGRGRRWFVNILLGLLIFACGAVTGGGVVARAAWNRVTTAIQYPEQMPERAAQHLTRLLRLDKAQSAEVRAILQRRAKAISEARSEMAPKIDVEVQGIRDDISAVLRPDQAKRWIRIFDDLRPKVFPPSGGAMVLQRKGR